MCDSRSHPPVAVSLGILAWNEESSLPAMLESLFAQSLFARLAARGEACEIVCLANGCTDNTVAIAERIFRRISAEHPWRVALRPWVANIPQPGRNNAWNRFVHEFSDRGARYVGLMDADILFHQPDTLELVWQELERHPRLGGASDWPVKKIGRSGRPSIRERLSLATSDMTGTIAGRLNGMLYILRAEVARNLYLPRDLGANDDGFFKAAICTDFFRVPLDPSRAVSVRHATHLYEPYLTWRDVLNNQKRQMIGQTSVHVLIKYLESQPAHRCAELARLLRENDARDPDWLKNLINAHVMRTRFFWRIFPDVLTFRWRRLAQLRGWRKITHFPAAAAGFLVTLIACWQAKRFLRRGMTAYWPKTERAMFLTTPNLQTK